MSFYFYFLQRMLSHPLCYLKRASLKALRPTVNVMPWISQSSLQKSSPLRKVSEGVGDRFILTDFVIIYTRFGSIQSLVSLEITTIASLTREISVIIPKTLLKKELT